MNPILNELGDAIAECEELMQQKFRVRGDVESDGFTLAWDRAGGGWAMRMRWAENDQALRDCSVENKIRAVEMIPKLFLRLERLAEEREDDAKRATATLRRFVAHQKRQSQ